MKKITIAAVLLLFCRLACSQSTRSPLSVPYTAIGVYSKNFNDVFSGMANQASLGQIKNAGAAIYAERRFMLKELSNYAAAIVLPTRLGGFGVAANYFGGSYFNSSRLGLGYGKKLGDKIDIGIQFNYNMLQLQGYGSSGIINVEAGTIWHASNRLHIGLHIYNPAGGKFGNEKEEKLAAVYTAGLGYEISDKVLISSEISKEEDQPVNINAGLQYIFSNLFFARMGIATATGHYFFGWGVQWKKCRIDAAANWHAQLGFTPGIMLMVHFGKDAKQEAN